MAKQLDEAVNKVRGRGNHSLVERIVVPVAATLASVATSYVIKKAPEVYRDRILPKVREKGGYEPLVQDLLLRAKQTVDSVLPAELPVPALSSRPSAGRDRRPERVRASTAERESKRRGRDQRRRARRQALSH